MPGLVMLDLMGGDYTFVVVDDPLWAQISALDPADMPGDDEAEKDEAWHEAVLWLTDEKPAERPAHVPMPAGRVLVTYCTQSGVPEPAGIQGPIWGIMSLRTV